MPVIKGAGWLGKAARNGNSRGCAVAMLDYQRVIGELYTNNMGTSYQQYMTWDFGN